MKNLSILIISLVIFNSVKGQLLINNCYDKNDFSIVETQNDDKGITKKLYLNKTCGNLKIYRTYGTNTSLTCYFVLPIAFREQAPVWLDIQCMEMVDYRFVRLDKFNVFIAARLSNYTDTIHLNWTSWVLEKQHDYSGIPASVPVPSFNSLPDSVKPYLMPTACVQWTDPFIVNISDSIRGTTNNLIVLANKIQNYCYNIPGPGTNIPYPPSCDAYYAMKWGGACTSHAHAAAAVFRENGIPCRVLMNAPTSVNIYCMHWFIEYYIPQYGWVKMEMNQNPYINAHKDPITFACNPEDEFPMLTTNNVEGYWITSNPNFTLEWCKHITSEYCNVTDTTAKVNLIISLTDSIHKYFTAYQGINLTTIQNNYFQIAKNYQYKAYKHIKSGLKDSLIYYLNKSLDNYRNIVINPLQTVFIDNFENGINGWTHGGNNDEWELGIPTYAGGPSNAYSGNNCWGTDMDGEYENNTNSWLISPSINLYSLSCAYLNVKIWNDVNDYGDCLWIELSTNNGVIFSPITKYLVGGLDFNNGAPRVPGWSRLVLDLTPYINNTIKIKFRFFSNASITRPGSYIDDVHIYGRNITTVSINENEIFESAVNIYPNPANNHITVEMQKLDKQCILSVYNISGQEVLKQQINKNNTQIDISNLTKGVYFIKLINVDGVKVEKIIKE